MLSRVERGFGYFLCPAEALKAADVLERGQLAADG